MTTAGVQASARIQEWQQLLAMAGDVEAKWTMFHQAAGDLARLVQRGEIERPDAADALTSLAASHNLGDTDSVQTVLADAFNNAELEHTILDDDARPHRNGQGNGQGLGESTHARPTAPPPTTVLWAYVARPWAAIPIRQWLHARHYCARYVVMTIAPPGFGKSSLVLCNAIEMITGRGLIGPAPQQRCNVAYWNAEESEREEIERRIAAICIAHAINPKDLEGHLHLGPKIADDQLRFARMSKGVVEPNVQLIKIVTEYIRDLRIDVLILDPLISFHRLPEIDTVAMETLIKGIFEPIAINTNCCIELSHHTRKTSNNNFGAEITVDDSRGAGAAAAACRSVRVLNRMTSEEAQGAKINDDERKLYLRVSRDKANMAPPSKARWIRLAGVDIDNASPGHAADNVQAAVAWSYPKPFDDVGVEDMNFLRAQVAKQSYRTDSRSPEWVGHVLAQHLGLDLDTKADRIKVLAVLKEWFGTGVLATEDRLDTNRRKREFVIPGKWKDEQAEALQSSLL